MITTPRKAVTRFFVPLIDVLILLFCIFLLMPFVSTPPNPDDADSKAKEPPLPTDVKELQDKVKDLSARLKEEERRVKDLERKSAARVTDRLLVRSIEIDGKTGALFYYDPDRVEITDKGEATKWINRQKALAVKDGIVKDIHVLFLCPRVPSGFPTKELKRQIEEWFPHMSIGYDDPFATN